MRGLLCFVRTVVTVRPVTVWCDRPAGGTRVRCCFKCYLILSRLSSTASTATRSTCSSNNFASRGSRIHAFYRSCEARRTQLQTITTEKKKKKKHTRERYSPMRFSSSWKSVPYQRSPNTRSDRVHDAGIRANASAPASPGVQFLKGGEGAWEPPLALSEL